MDAEYPYKGVVCQSANGLRRTGQVAEVGEVSMPSWRSAEGDVVSSCRAPVAARLRWPVRCRSHALQNLPDHFEQGSGRGNQRSLSSPVLHLSIEPFLEDGAALAYGGPSGLHQGCKQPLVGALDGSALLLARRPIVAGAHPRPTGQVLGAGKLRHVASGFCQNHAAVSAAMPGIVCNSSYSRSKGWSFSKILWLSSVSWFSKKTRWSRLC